MMSVRCRRLLGVLVGVLVVGLAGSIEGYAQPDSVRAEILKQNGFAPDHSPTGALWRSAAVPGWGQSYNQQHYKIPFIYAGLAALGYSIYATNQEYVLFKRAHLFGRGPELAEGDGNPYAQYQSQFEEVAARLGTERLSVMREQRDQFRRRRNLSILGMGLFYALNVLDAYVSAHLLTFDVGETLGIRVRPIGRLRGGRRQHGGVLERARAGRPPATDILERGPGMRMHVEF